MNDSRLFELTSKVDTLTIKILVPLRASKELNREAVGEFEEILDELRRALDTEDLVAKDLVGKLWFVFVTMLAEANYAKENKRDIEMAAWKIESKLQSMFGPHF